VTQATPGEPFLDEPSGATDAPVSGTWTLPVELATATGVLPDVGWTLEQRGTDTVLALRATQVHADDADGLLVSIDHATAPWVPFVRDPEAADVLVAELPSGAVNDAVGLRLRSRPVDSLGEGDPPS
jgi:hypothetical protein